MDGRNSFGRRISLLNEGSEVENSLKLNRPAPRHLSTSSLLGARTLAFHTRPQSYASSPNSSPPTPELVRSDSSDSSNMNSTPSPTTPSSQFDFNSLADPTKQGDALFAHNAFFSPQLTQQDPSNYPPIPQHAAVFTYPAPPSIAPQPSLYQQPAPPAPPSDHDSSRPPQPSSSTTPTSKPGSGSKKNSYPCPLAKQYACTDYFTTSGHAARHAKKHTGKKDAFCPECNKAFTRKDNMEQHRRTHQNGRTSIKASGEGPSKRQKTTQSSKQSTTSDQQQQLPMPPAMSSLDPSLAHSPASSYGGYSESAFVPNIPGQQTYPVEILQASPFTNGPYQTMSNLYDPALGSVNGGSTGGLDALAIAAAKRDENF
ncbi:hypothetical protein E2P81_ATG05072 [Venturia nashicola]|uniref:C2H2-type domain-containing protein n=1 Tax=Venturia nashicola TaxID=86259 RepID=A0A4Z1P358_9PEZI|nr:hypothetical protein E6O75_ATG05198 [Venturia nashicola]TLD34907.1 hypothetical protein E2P81_ATG05072 [Venturia nashicola]